MIVLLGVLLAGVWMVWKGTRASHDAVTHELVDLD